MPLCRRNEKFPRKNSRCLCRNASKFLGRWLSHTFSYRVKITFGEKTILNRINIYFLSGDETNLDQLANGPACQKYMTENKLKPDELLHDFFKWYVKITAEKGFHVDGWEEVWEYEDPKNPGFYKIYDPKEWGVDLDNVTLTGYHWNNMWLEGQFSIFAIVEL